jgi:hypothetical protein
MVPYRRAFIGTYRRQRDQSGSHQKGRRTVSQRTPDTYFSAKKMEKRTAAAQDRVKVRAADLRTAKHLRAKLKRKR